METTQNKGQAVLLSTNNPTFPCITQNPNGEYFWNTMGLVKGIGYKYYHVYILSNEEIEEGDWYYTILDKEFHQASKDTVHIMSEANKDIRTTYRNTHFKIIATTSRNLHTKEITSFGRQFPKPAEHFLFEWTEKGCPLNINVDYKLEYYVEPIHFHEEQDAPDNIRLTLIVSPTNTIECSLIEIPVIVEAKDDKVYTRAEVVELLRKLNATISFGSDMTLEQWMEKEL